MTVCIDTKLCGGGGVGLGSEGGQNLERYLGEINEYWESECHPIGWEIVFNNMDPSMYGLYFSLDFKNT